MKTPQTIGLSDVPGSAAWTGDALYRRHADDVRVFLRHLVGNDDDAEDLTQDVFGSAWRSLRSGFAPTRSERAWLFRIARNRAVDFWRRRRFRSLFVRYEDVPESASEPEHEAAAAVWSALDRLPRNWREAVVLRYRWEWTPAEIGELQGRSEGAVRALLSRALDRMQVEIKEV